jgi:hypothetical protein
MPAVLSAFCVEVLRRNTWPIRQPISNYLLSLYVIETVFSAHLAFTPQPKNLKFDRSLAAN